MPPRKYPIETPEYTATDDLPVPDTLVTDTMPEQHAVTEYPKDLYSEAHSENTKRDFMRKVAEARAPKPEPPPPQPVAPRIMEQTRLEMEAGAERVRLAELERVNRPKPMPEKGDGTNTPVLRPDAYDEYVKSFRSQAQTVSKDALGRA